MNSKLFSAEICDIDVNLSSCPTSADLKLIKRIGENLSATIFDDVDMFEIVSQDGLIEEFLHSKSCITAFKHLEEIISSITHRYPDIDVLEIGQFDACQLIQSFPDTNLEV